MPVDAPLDAVPRRVRAALSALGDSACIRGDLPVSGSGLLARIDHFRDGLAALGIGPGALVGIGLPRSPDQVAAIFGVLERGAAYVPLDPEYPVARRRFMAEDAGLAFTLDAPFPDSSPPSPIVESDLSELAYVMYTSGSTGRPKGVEITHRNLAVFLRSWDSLVDPARPGVWLAHTSLSFDPSVVELLWTLAVGAPIVLAPEGSAWSGGVVGDLITRFGITHLQCTPTRARMLLVDELDRSGMAGLQRVFVGGEVLTAALANDLAALGPRITNIYGPTETTVWAFAHEVTNPAHDPISIGRPLVGVDVRVCRPDRSPAPDGELGELVLFGADVGRGYRDRPEQTEAQFITIDGRRGYATGDLGSLEPDGSYAFAGRNDAQIKLRGNRIEPAEVESALLAHPGVELAAVVVREPVPGAPRLVAFVQAPSSVGVDADALRRLAGERLPSDHVPTLFVIVEHLPQTPSGKIDRGALEVPVTAALAVSSGAIIGTDGGDGGGPGTSPEVDEDASRLALITGIWSRVLSRLIGPDDDFFAVGGDSLAAVAILAELQRQTGRRVGLSSIVDAPTPRLLIDVIRDRRSRARTPIVVGLRRARVASRRLFLVHGAGGNVVNLVPFAHRLPANIDVVGLQAVAVATDGAVADASLEAMVERYVAAIRGVQPTGPYFVGGYSDGGLIAWEIAGRLLEGGQPVGGVVLLDTHFPENDPLRLTLPLRIRNLWRGVRQRQRPLAQWMRDVAIAIRQPHRTMDAPPRDIAALGTIDVQADVEAAVRAYRPEPLAVDAVLVRAAWHRPFLWRDYGWEPLVGGRLTVRFAPGDHLGLLEVPHVDIVAAAVTEFLTHQP